MAPAATTVTGVSASSRRSAEMSKLVSAPRCTPPMPPVAKTLMPARCAQIIVAATVVAPVPPVGEAGGKIGAGKLGDVCRLPQPVKLRLGQADVDLMVEDGDRGGGGAMGADLSLNPARGFHILREWHAVGDDCAFKRNDGAAVRFGLGHFSEPLPLSRNRDL